MQSTRRLSYVGMAAAPRGNHTAYAHLEGTGLPGARYTRPILRLTTSLDIRGLHRRFGRHP